MSKNTKIKFGKAVRASKWHRQSHAILVNRGGEWIESGRMTVSVEEEPAETYGKVRTLISSYEAALNGVRLVAEVRSLGDVVQSAASARSSLKNQILEALKAETK